MKRDVVGELIDLLLPSGCVACGAWVRGGASLVCAGCRTRLRVPSWPRCARCHHPRGTGRALGDTCIECREWCDELSMARYAFVLEPPANDVVHALKYEGWRELAHFAADALVSCAADLVSGPKTIIVPVPTTARRLREREYNQAELIGVALSRRIDVGVFPALTRREGGRSQTALSPDQRRDNVRGVFSIADRAKGRVRGSEVLLVDDVLTTGATASEAASTLVGGGASSVSLVAFARALPSRRRAA